ncbi:MAG: 4-hydroxy-tetrahydrodipicolinate reductase [Candidatus Lernaella stagnicola]|nr:4-hydroxy-tetrahydrodipicolinate reductase [Candidatus Lernaella stagnicola]
MEEPKRDDLRVVVTGAMGRIGRALVRYIHDADGMTLVGATERPDHPDIAKDVGLLVCGEPSSVMLESELRNAVVSAQVIIDFTAPEATAAHAGIAARFALPLVIGTTGLSGEHRAAVQAAADKTAIVAAPNMSIGVNLLFHLARRAAEVIGEDCDIEIVESHHRNKVDAPSGTALRLAEIVGEALGYEDPSEYYLHGREGHTGVRPGGRIGLHAVRGGGVVGEHDLQFLADAEVLTLSHRALTRDNFVRGAVRAAYWLQDRAPGLYDMGDVLGLK